MYRDDEDEGLARPEDQYRSDKKEVRQKRAAESKGNLLKLQRAVLRGKVGKDGAKSDRAKEETGPKSERAEKAEAPPETFGTKTHMQEEKTEVLNVGDKQTNEQMMKQQQKHEEAKQQAGEEYQSDAG
ncbi:MAG: hypothetical protein AAB544_01350 [Patescibacteria group bacterium]